MTNPILLPDEIREYINDSADQNHLLDGVEFSNTRIALAMDLAVEDFNLTPPNSGYTVESFPYKGILLTGTLAKLFKGQAALLARNTMNYQDGGISVPVEERFQYYQELVSLYEAEFKEAVSKIKIASNMDFYGWGGIASDYGRMPIY